VASLPSSPRIAAIIVAYNGAGELFGCVESVLAQTVGDLEVIVVDNASTDGSIDALERLYGGRIKTIRRRENSGYAAGANDGWRYAHADLVAILNQDLILAPDCIERLVDAYQAWPSETIASPKLLLKSDPQFVNAIGNEVHLSGVAWCYGLGTPRDAWRGTFEVTAISGAAFLTHRRTLDQLGGLEEGYFMYFEDVDLSLRARLAGITPIVACESIATHDWELVLTPQRFETLERNRRAMWLRFWGGDIRMRPFLAQAELQSWVYALVRGRGYLRAKRRAAASSIRLSHIGDEGNALRRVMSRAHPYQMIFPGRKRIAALGRIVDRIVTTVCLWPNATARARRTHEAAAFGRR
jgi:GT2 family glycosyltransferase